MNRFIGVLSIAACVSSITTMPAAMAVGEAPAVNNAAPAASAPAGAPNGTTVPLGGSVSATAPLTQAEEWVLHRGEPWQIEQSQAEKKKKRPIRNFTKAVAKGVASEVGATVTGIAQDMVFCFSVQDIDPYDKKPPMDKPQIVLEFRLVDGSSAYLRRFPDGSFAVEDGFADGTVINPSGGNTYVIKYPNGVQGKVVRTRNSITVYRPDKTVTTFTKNLDGGYSINNDQLGYMGTASPDREGLNYELGSWKE